MLNEDWIRKYMNNCTKEAIIELYLQMRFERDMYADMYENLRVISKGNDKQWSLNDSKVKFGYELAKSEVKADGN